MSDKTRANKNDAGVAQNRGDIYARVVEQYNKAIESRFFIEATALAESLIGDRMESRLSYLNQADVKFESLGKTRALLSAVESNANIKTLINTKVNKWVEERNKVIHRAAKISKERAKDWEDYLNNAKAVAEEGFGIFRELDRLMQLKEAQ